MNCGWGSPTLPPSFRFMVPPMHRTDRDERTDRRTGCDVICGFLWTVAAMKFTVCEFPCTFRHQFST